MKSFYSFFEQAEDTASQPPQRLSNDLVTTFGRHNPPHLGHKLGLDMADDVAGGIGDDAPADQRFYSSRSFDPKKNPLPFEMKMKFLKKMFPDHENKWDEDPAMRTILGAATKGHQDGYKNFHFIGGGDRKDQMENLLRKYNGDLYDFDNIYSHSAGERMDDGEDLIAKLSASRQRKHAQNDDFTSFKDGLKFHDKFKETDARELFRALQMFGEKNEDWEINPRDNQEFLRELYTDGNLFNEGDLVESLSSGLVGKVHRCGANHIICVTEEGIMFKNFIHDLQAV